jgi:mobilization protein NikA
MMGVSRTRSAGAKVTDEEYEQLAALAQARGLTLGEWCREVLLTQLAPSSATLPEKAILTELLGLRMIVINLLRALGTGEPLTAEKTQTVIDWADKEKAATAVECLREHTARNKL